MEVSYAGVALVEGMGARVKLVASDIAASDGVIHVIDGVLLPGA